MELVAAIRALSSLHESCDIEIYTDSRYLQDGITKWLTSWKQRGWLTANKKPVKNKDLWEDLSTLVVKHKVKWNWVKGHSGDFLNERADVLANKGINL